ncbi:hypothetical protein GOBAR_DD25047 [Gossypium barbadense]|nr:hypothetical protein GOBAR_DD25047 [Gossypium barbadense]
MDVDPTKCTNYAASDEEECSKVLLLVFNDVCARLLAHEMTEYDGVIYTVVLSKEGQIPSHKDESNFGL